MNSRGGRPGGGRGRRAGEEQERGQGGERGRGQGEEKDRAKGKAGRGTETGKKRKRKKTESEPEIIRRERIRCIEEEARVRETGEGTQLRTQRQNGKRVQERETERD